MAPAFPRGATPRRSERGQERQQGVAVGLRQLLEALAAGGAFAVGILLFSGSLYLLTLSGIGKLGMITPFGGVAFLIGWLCLGLAAWRLA